MTDQHERASINDSVAHRLHRTNRLLLTHLGRFLEGAGAGLTPEQFFVVMKLHEGGRMPQSQLVDVTLGDGPNVSRLVDKLVTSGFVERLVDPTDRRTRLLRLTGRGTRVAAELQVRLVPERRSVFAGIREDELDVLLEILQHIDDNMRGFLATRDIDWKRPQNPLDRRICEAQNRSAPPAPPPPHPFHHSRCGDTDVTTRREAGHLHGHH